MPKAKRLITSCATCGGEINDFASNRRKSKSGKFFCSNKCRGVGVAAQISVALGGDGVKRTKPEKDARHYRKNADHIRKGAGAYYWRNRTAILAKKKADDRAAKAEVIKAYGGKCVCCGVDYQELLTIDHINGDGHLHRRKVGKGRRIYKDLIKLGFPKKGYRLLCFNCNISRGFYGYCPHMPEDRQKISHVPFNPGRKRIVA